ARVDPAGCVGALASLLRSPSGTVRTQAAATLVGRVRAEHVPLLAEAGREASADARERIVDLIASFEGPDTADFLLEGLEDASPRVAFSSAAALARSGRQEERLNARILQGRPDRGWGYSTLALAMREDVTLEPAFADGVEDSLLVGLGTADPFVAGAAAVGLATIGFRREDSSNPQVLDRAVPSTLVASVATERFYRDFSSLHDLAIRRLSLLVGDGVLRSGPEWGGWWATHRTRFRAQRAGLPVAPGEERSFVVRYEREGAPGSREQDPSPPLRAVLGYEGAVAAEGESETFLLSGEEIEDLARQARESGILDARVRPGVRGAPGSGLRRLVFRVGDRRKEVGWGRGAGPASFLACEAAVLDLLARNRWQRYFDVDAARSRADFVREARGSIERLKEPVDLAARWRDLVLAAYDDLGEGDRARAIEDLAGMPEVGVVFGEGDAALLLANLSRSPSPA
ncbi:MAG: HEAT repeat domain-containing protein, partial [Planctomycetota bacterium]